MNQQTKIGPYQPIRRSVNASESESFPLSFGQEQLWLFQQLEPDVPAYNIPFNVRLKGRLNVAALEQSLNEIRRRHDALRATFACVDGWPVQNIAPAQLLALPIIDLQGLNEAKREMKVEHLAFEEAQRPFDLARGPLLRTMLLRLGAEDHVLLRTLHHIVCDGWSIDVFTRELAALYEAYSIGRPSPLSELPIQHADFVRWQRERLQGALLESQVGYWKQQLSGSPPVLPLPANRPRPARQTYRGAYEKIELPSGIISALRALSRDRNVTLFMILLAAFATLLYRYTGQDDIPIGTAIANRSRVETRGLIAFLLNLVVLRNDLSGNPTLRQLLARVREMALAAYAHQDLPYGKLVEKLQPARNPSYNPLFQVFLVIEPPRRERALAGLRHAHLDVHSGSVDFDLTLQIVEQGSGLMCYFKYNTDLFDAATIQRMARHFHGLLESIAANPE